MVKNTHIFGDEISLPKALSWDLFYKITGKSITIYHYLLLAGGYQTG